MSQKISQKVNQTTMVLWIFYGYASANLQKGIGVLQSAKEFCNNPYYNDDGKLTVQNIKRGYYYVVETLRDGRRSNKTKSGITTNA